MKNLRPDVAGLLVVLLVLNLIATLRSKGEAALPESLVTEVQAGSVAVMTSSNFVTCSEDGRTLYLWVTEGTRPSRMETHTFRVP